MGSSTIATKKAPNVPRPPSIAVSGTCDPLRLKLPGIFHIGVPSADCGRPVSGRSLRRRMTEMCATVNESVAPKE